MATTRNATVNLDGDVSGYIRSLSQARAATSAFTKGLDTSNDRMSMLVQSSLALGPALVPIGAAAVPAIAGLTSSLALAAGGAGVAVLAFQGIGDALKATNDYAIEPTSANFDKMQQSLSEISPAGREFVGFLQEIRPELQGLQDAAQEGLLPGAEEGIRQLMEVLPQAEQVVGTFGESVGTLLAEAGDNLNDPRWVEFFEFIEGEARTTLVDFGRSLGNLAEGFGNLWMAFDPLSDDFSASFLQMSRDFAQWSDGLSQTEGFQSFVEYIQANGPQAWETLGALGGALLEVVEAAAPIGAVALPVIEALADAIGALADTPLGPTVVGVLALTSAYSRLYALSRTAGTSSLGGLLNMTALGGGVSNIRAATSATKELTAAQSKLATNPGMQGIRQYRENLAGVAAAERKAADATKARNRQFIAGGSSAAALGLMMSGLDQKLGLTNTSTLALAGSMASPFGTAIGAGVGLTLDLVKASNDLAGAIDNANAAATSGNLEQMTAALEDLDAKTRASLEGQGGFGDSIANWAETAQRTNPFMSGLAGAIDQVTSSASEGSPVRQALVSSIEKETRAAADAALAEAGFGSSMDSASESARAQAVAIAENINQHNRLADAALRNAGGMIGLEQAIDDASAAAAENGATLDINTQAGRDNKSALLDLANSWNELTPAQQGATGEAERVRAKFIEVASQMTNNRAEAHLLADQYLDIPGNVSTTAEMRDQASQKANRVLDLMSRLDGFNSTPGAQLRDEASPSIRAVLDRLGALDGKTATTFIRTVQVGAVANAALSIFKADGGTVDYYANGGVRENRVAQIAPAGAMRVWAEPETGGEAYIPFATSKRARSLDIWAETGKRLGVQGFADGAMLAASKMQPMSPMSQGLGRASATEVRTSLIGAQVAIDPRTNIGTFVKGEVATAILEQSRTTSDEFRKVDRGGRYARS